MKIKKILFTIFILSLVLGMANFVSADDLTNAFDSNYLQKTGGTAGYDTSQTDPNPIISTVITIALSFLAVIFLILMVYGGFLWMTDRGNTEQVEKAKKLITAAIIGLIIVVAAYAISIYVVEIIGGEGLDKVPTEVDLGPGGT